ncbi:helix-turn-helix domain-containing protein [Chishuiella changwenlii]|jgi:DNA-binding HxlR family transcriptional regulator|uniref:winged helix-turn-helix transcriptional regulator n=1 Tax=Chishuiella changwenlii TaxID=1434701 RepID=UPI002FD98BFC
MIENKINETDYNFDLNGIFKVIGGKWKIPLIKAIGNLCPRRFGELRKEMENLAQTTLTTQLRELERDGIITRKVFPESPPRVEYQLTELGQSLTPVIDTLEEWWNMYNNKGCRNF